jgi:hypothetical protein
MNLENLRNSQQLLLEDMIVKGYSQNYVQQIRYNIGLLLSSSRRWESYDDILKHYTETIADKRKRIKKKAILNVIASFDCYGTIPANKDAPMYFKHLSSYDFLNAEYKSLVDNYSSFADRNRKKETTIRNECWNFSSFLIHLQKLGRESLLDVMESDVLSVLTDLNGYPCKSASFCGQITAVFKKLAENDSECQRLLLYVPTMRKGKKNI